jgi:hypothetical protein
MARVGVSITKSFSFRGAAQEFSNTYYYQTSGVVNASIADALIDNLAAKEKLIHGTGVSFVRGKCWTAGGTKAENNMLAQKPLTGTGSANLSVTSPIDRERAFLVRFRAGNDSKGRPVYLRKWWHLDVSSISTTAISNAQLQQTAPLDSAQRTALQNTADGFKSVSASTTNFDLVSEKGRAIDGPTVAHPYLEHHQLGDMWR